MSTNESGGPVPVPAETLSREPARLHRATELAWAWHGTQTRKGRVTSYMGHLLQVQGLVVGAGGGPDAAIAALLHDALEDAESPAERAAREIEIEAEFGRTVLGIVLDLTDTTPEEAGASKGPWRARKERYLAQLRAAGPTSRLVAACDKRQNLGDLVADLRIEGPATLDRFNAGPSEQVWYFRSMETICRPAIPATLASDMATLLDELERIVAPQALAKR